MDFQHLKHKNCGEIKKRVEVKSDFHQTKSKSLMNYNLQPFGWCSKMKPAQAVESCASINLSSPMKQQYSTGSLKHSLGLFKGWNTVYGIWGMPLAILELVSQVTASLICLQVLLLHKWDSHSPVWNIFGFRVVSCHLKAWQPSNLVWTYTNVHSSVFAHHDALQVSEHLTAWWSILFRVPRSVLGSLRNCWYLPIQKLIREASIPALCRTSAWLL